MLPGWLNVCGVLLMYTMLVMLHLQLAFRAPTSCTVARQERLEHVRALVVCTTWVPCTQPDTVLRKFLKLHGLEMFYSVLDEFLIRVK